ncbi:DUF1800 domain-containing protein [Oxalobacteraceae bacterium A2-2]
MLPRIRLTLTVALAAACCAVAASPEAPVPAAGLQPGGQQLAEHVLNRLAYGPAPGDIERVRRMGVAAYIDEQLNPSAIPLPEALQARLAALETAQAPAGATLGAFLAARKEAREDGTGAAAQRKQLYTRMTVETEAARIERAIASPRQLEEVMVDFWYNHFNVYIGKGLDRALVASYERDAIRPYALGSFRALLGATAKHPAMLYYLDNWLSTGKDFQPRGKAGGQKAKSSGLNENYARELMELHTLGVDGGYTQKDVTELARMLTGWTYDNRELVRSNVGFAFDPRRHDRGGKEWLGRRVAGAGQAEGEQALDVLAMHPATARHVSYQLAQYFVQDDPPPALVERMAATWMASQGNIAAVLRTLFTSPEFTAPAAIGAKFKTPYQYVISAIRASGVQITKVEPVLGALNRLGMPLYGCQTPDGYKNTQDAWLNPDALNRRIAFANTLAGYAPALDAARLEATLGGALSAQTRSAVAQGPQQLQTAMILGSPDFMQR